MSHCLLLQPPENIRKFYNFTSGSKWVTIITNLLHLFWVNVAFWIPQKHQKTLRQHLFKMSKWLLKSSQGSISRKLNIFKNKEKQSKLFIQLSLQPKLQNNLFINRRLLLNSNLTESKRHWKERLWPPNFELLSKNCSQKLSWNLLNDLKSRSDMLYYETT